MVLFAGEIGKLPDGNLHPIGHFILLHPSANLEIADDFVKLAVERPWPLSKPWWISRLTSVAFFDDKIVDIFFDTLSPSGLVVFDQEWGKVKKCRFWALHMLLNHAQNMKRSETHGSSGFLFLGEQPFPESGIFVSAGPGIVLRAVILGVSRVAPGFFQGRDHGS